MVKPILQLKSWVNRVLGAGSALHYIPVVLFPPLSVWTQTHVCWYAPSVSQLCCLSLKKRPDERSSIPPHSSPSQSRHLLCSLSALTAWLTPFPLSAPRYNVTCHQGPFHLRRDPAAGCPRGESLSREEGGALSVNVVQVRVQHAVALINPYESSRLCSEGLFFYFFTGFEISVSAPLQLR